MWAQAINAVLGIWLMMSPWILNFSGSGRIVDRIGGPIVLTVGVFAMREVTRWGRWVNILPGAWVLVAPWAFHYTNWVPIINGVLIGIAIIALALVRGTVKESFGVGWLGVLIAGREDLRHWWKHRQQRKRLSHQRDEQHRQVRKQPTGRLYGSPSDEQQQALPRP